MSSTCISPRNRANRASRTASLSPPVSHRAAVQNMQAISTALSRVNPDSRSSLLTRGNMEKVILKRTASSISQRISAWGTPTIDETSAPKAASPMSRGSETGRVKRQCFTRSAKSRGLAKCFADVIFLKTRGEGSSTMYYSSHSTLDESGTLRKSQMGTPNTPVMSNTEAKPSNMRERVPSPSDSICETPSAAEPSRPSSQQLIPRESVWTDIESRDTGRLSEADLLCANTRSRSSRDYANRFVASKASPPRDIMYSSKAVRPRSVRGDDAPQIPFNKSTGVPGVSDSAIRKQPPDLTRTFRDSKAFESLGYSRSFSTKIQPPRISSQPQPRARSSEARVTVKPAVRLAFPKPPKKQELTPKEREMLFRQRMHRGSTWISDQIDGKPLTIDSAKKKFLMARDCKTPRSSSAQSTFHSMVAGLPRMASPRIKVAQHVDNEQTGLDLNGQIQTPRALTNGLQDFQHSSSFLYAHPTVPSPVRGSNPVAESIPRVSENIYDPAMLTFQSNRGNLTPGPTKRTVVVEPRRTSVEFTAPASVPAKQLSDYRPRTNVGNSTLHQDHHPTKTRRTIEPQTINPPIRPARPIPPPNHNLQIYKQSLPQTRHQSNSSNIPHNNEIIPDDGHVVLRVLENEGNPVNQQYAAPGASCITSSVFDLHESSLQRATSGFDVVNLLPDLYYEQGDTIALAVLPELMRELSTDIDIIRMSGAKSSAGLDFSAPRLQRKRAISSSSVYEQRRRGPKPKTKQSRSPRQSYVVQKRV